MTAADAPSMVLVDTQGRPAGILTDSDLRRRVLAAGLDPATPIQAVASAPVVTVSGDALAFEAAQMMLANQLHHLVVLEGGRPLGVLADGDLLAAQAGGPLFVARQIDRASSLEALVNLRTIRVQAIRRLVHAGLSGEAIGRLTAETNDHLIRRILALLEAELGPPPVAYCWLGIGSEGRREQGLRTDQDNALVHADPPADLAQEAEAYFGRLAARAVAVLEQCGFPRCTGDMMASNPRWCRPLAAWRQLFLGWVRRPEPEALYGAEIFFDLRGLSGDMTLADQLWSEILESVAEGAVFRRLLLTTALQYRPALGLFGRLALERHGEWRGTIQVKTRGVMPVVELARAAALEHGIGPTNTFERLRLLRERGAIPPQDADDLLAAYEYLTHLRFAHHVERLEAGQPPDDFVDPRRLPRVEREALRGHLQMIADIQAYVSSQTAFGAHE
jgi:CBS domain-containing protein